MTQSANHYKPATDYFPAKNKNCNPIPIPCYNMMFKRPIKPGWNLRSSYEVNALVQTCDEQWIL